MAQKLYLVWDQKYGHFTDRVKKSCLYYTIKKENW